MPTILSLLNKDAMSWWAHRELREKGDIRAARKMERRSIRAEARDLRMAIETGGWMEVYSDNTIFYCGPEMHICDPNGKRMEDATVKAAIHLGITVIDFTHLGEEIHYEVMKLPMPNPWRPDRGTVYGSMSRCPLYYYIERVEKLGARFINKDAALAVERKRNNVR